MNQPFRESDDDKFDEREDEVVVYPLDEGVTELLFDDVVVEMAKLPIAVLLALVLSVLVAGSFKPFDEAVDAIVLIVVEVPSKAGLTLLE